jgi:hypothetical protein
MILGTCHLCFVCQDYIRPTAASRSEAYVLEAHDNATYTGRNTRTVCLKRFPEGSVGRKGNGGNGGSCQAMTPPGRISST